MVSIQNLEKLINIQTVFRNDQSLEAIVGYERLSSLISLTEQLLRQRGFLREERRKVRLNAERIEDRKNASEIMRSTDWLPKNINLNTSEVKLKLNINGMVFEVPKSVIEKDPKSILFSLLSKDPPIACDSEGYFFFNRDWWLFRYIIIFLRDGNLPDDRILLSQLYREAKFWNITELQSAIEVEKVTFHCVYLEYILIIALATFKERRTNYRFNQMVENTSSVSIVVI